MEVRQSQNREYKSLPALLEYSSRGRRGSHHSSAVPVKLHKYFGNRQQKKKNQKTELEFFTLS